jgi:hypothetical protein
VASQNTRINPYDTRFLYRRAVLLAYTHIIYQSLRTERRPTFPGPIPRTEAAPTAHANPPDELPPTPDMIPWTPPRPYSANGLLGKLEVIIEVGGCYSESDDLNLSLIEEGFYPNGPPDGSAGSEVVH